MGYAFLSLVSLALRNGGEKEIIAKGTINEEELRYHTRTSGYAHFTFGIIFERFLNTLVYRDD